MGDKKLIILIAILVEEKKILWRIKDAFDEQREDNYVCERRIFVPWCERRSRVCPPE